jgi:hypothetical protein
MLTHLSESIRTVSVNKENHMNQFALATEVNGIVMRLALPTMTKLQAEQKAKTLRELSPNTPIYVVNKTAE